MKIIKAFTMAEILISLTIIGVIAAITLPALRANINEATWATQRKALYSRLSQAISMLPSLNGYGIGSTQEETNEKAALAFVTDGLSKVLKINNICNSTSLTKCGIPTKITTMPDVDTGKNLKINFPTNLTELNPMFTFTYTSGNITYENPQKDINTVATALETSNGESMVIFYNPLCQPDNEEIDWHYTQPNMCANFIYDLNGKKGPNTVGKDIGFITALYPTDSELVAPIPLTQNAKNGSEKLMSVSDASAACRVQDIDSRVPNRDELTAMFYNRKLIGVGYGQYWSKSLTSFNSAWVQDLYVGRQLLVDVGDKRNVRCIKR